MTQFHKVLFLNFLVTFLFLSPKCGAQTDTQVCIAFYNVENLFDTIDDPEKNDEEFLPSAKIPWTSERYTKKLENLSKVISSINHAEPPAIIGLSEIENRYVLEDLVGQDSLKKYNFSIVHEETDDLRGIDVALLYQSEKFTYLSHSTIIVPIPGESKFFGRPILYVIGVLEGQDTLHIFVNHWKSRYGGQKETEPKRIEAAKALRRTVDDLFAKNANSKIVIIGDFNDEPPDPSLIEYLNAQRPDTEKQSQLVNLLYPFDDKGEGSHYYKGKWGTLDNIIVSSALLKPTNGYYTMPSSAVIFKKDWMLYKTKEGTMVPNRTKGYMYFGGYSDHLPVSFVLIKEK